MAAKIFDFAMCCRRRKVIPAALQPAPRPIPTPEEKEAAKNTIGGLKPWKVRWEGNRLELHFEVTKIPAVLLNLPLPKFRDIFNAVAAFRCGEQRWQVKVAWASYNQACFPCSRVVVLRVAETQPSGGDTCFTDYSADLMEFEF